MVKVKVRNYRAKVLDKVIATNDLAIIIDLKKTTTNFFIEYEHDFLTESWLI